MKYIIIIGDGMADEPLAEYGGKTPLQVADIPAMDELARSGRCGRLMTIPDTMHPGSEVANLSILGYPVEIIFEGRGVLEAASMGLTLGEEDLALRCNLICVEKDSIRNHSAGHISNNEAHELIDFLNEKFGSEVVSFHKGVSYRHLMVVKGGSKQLICTAPHDVPGKPFAGHLIKAASPEGAETAALLNDLIMRSMEVLSSHPVNQRREASGKDKANSIWPWSPGHRPRMQTLSAMFGIRRSAVISAVDLIQGIGVYAGMDIIRVEGATGLYDTNYEGKAAAAMEALKTHDLVYLHVEASDEAGHEGNAELKIKTIEYLDHRIVRHVAETATHMREPVTIAVLPDHPTPCATTLHSREPVPFIIFKPDDKPDRVTAYDEFSVREGSYGLLKGDEFIRTVLASPTFRH